MVSLCVELFSANICLSTFDGTRSKEGKNKNQNNHFVREDAGTNAVMFHFLQGAL